jgi:hypothetical protein
MLLCSNELFVVVLPRSAIAEQVSTCSNRSDGLIIVGRYNIALHTSHRHEHRCYLVAGLVLALVLGIWSYAITIWLFFKTDPVHTALPPPGRGAIGRVVAFRLCVWDPWTRPLDVTL